jgi:hypothetical protein
MAVLDQQQRRRVEESMYPAEPKHKPIQQIIPGEDRRDEDDALGDRVVVRGHRILSRIRNEHDDQETGGAERARLTPK